LAEVGGFSAGMAPAEEADRCDPEEAGFDGPFAAVKPVDGIILEARGAEQALEEQGNGGEIDAENTRMSKGAGRGEDADTK
jgi:hypothetical protein